MKTYNRFPIVLERGEGVCLYDTGGKEYLDFGAGIAVCALGYSNEQYKNALKGQIDQLMHTSNLFYNTPAVEAAGKLLRATGLDKVFFTNSGTEAVEGALKVALKYAYNKDPGKNYHFIAMNHSFHGRSLGSLSVTGNPHYQEAFLQKEFCAVLAEYNNLEDVAGKITDTTCGIIMETVQGEGGIYPAEKEFIRGVRRLCDERDILFILDEIQCGMGRCGSMFAYEQYGVKPDVLTCAKALGCGIPVGAFVTAEKCSTALVPGDHGTTYGGNPLAAAAVSAVLDIYQEKGIVEHARQMGAYLTERLDELVRECDLVKERRGLGLMQGLELTAAAGPVVSRCLEEGLIVMSAGSQVIRLVPPLVITEEHIDQMLRILRRALG